MMIALKTTWIGRKVFPNYGKNILRYNNKIAAKYKAAALKAQNMEQEFSSKLSKLKPFQEALNKLSGRLDTLSDGDIIESVQKLTKDHQISIGD